MTPQERQAEITRAFERLDDIGIEQDRLIERIQFLLRQGEAEHPREAEKPSQVSVAGE